MYIPKDIDVNRSISSGFLKYRKGADYYVQTGMNVLSFAFLAACFYLMSKQIGNSPNDQFFANFLIPAGYFFCGYFIASALLRDKLLVIGTRMKAERNREILIEFFEKKGYAFFDKSANRLILTEPENIGPSHNLNTIVVLIENGRVHFHIQKEKKSWNMPLLSIYLLRSDLKKLFEK